MFLRERQRFESDEEAKRLMFSGDQGLIRLVEIAYHEVQDEMKKLREEKMLIQMEEKVRERVREKL